MGRHILHIDMNCFYASVEMQRHPEYRNVPLAVCGSQEDRHGIVLTANYLAKPRGVKVGQAIWQAKQVCPELVTLPPDMSEYIRFSHMAREIYEDYTDQIEPFGLDENWLDVTGSVGCKGSPMAIAQEISERIKFELGITASIGVADNKITAKLGSDYKKPDAITRIEADNYREIVYPLPVDDLLYVGPATSRKLHGIGVHTIGQLAELDTDCLVHKFGKMGIVLKTFAMGQDRTPVTKTDHIPTIKSVGNSATTPRDMTCDEDVHLMLLLLAESVTSRMRELCSKCTTVEVSVRDTGLSWFTRQRKLPMPSCSSDELAEAAFQLFKANYRWQSPIRSIGIRGSGLVEASPFAQCSVFRKISVGNAGSSSTRLWTDCATATATTAFAGRSCTATSCSAASTRATITPSTRSVSLEDSDGQREEICASARALRRRGQNASGRDRIRRRTDLRRRPHSGRAPSRLPERRRRRRPLHLPDLGQGDVPVV